MNAQTDMSGLWSGSYFYDGRIGAVPFTATIIENNGEIFGTTLETATFGMGETEDLAAEISGTRRGLSVDFRKLYEASTGIAQPPLAYTGDANRALTEVRGIWRFTGLMRSFIGGPTGTFTMTRVVSNLEAAKVTAGSSLAS